MFDCPKCGKEIPLAENSCPECGAAVEEVRKLFLIKKQGLTPGKTRSLPQCVLLLAGGALVVAAIMYLR